MLINGNYINITGSRKGQIRIKKKNSSMTSNLNNTGKVVLFIISCNNHVRF